MRSGPKPQPLALQTGTPAVPDLLSTVPNPPVQFDETAACQWWETAQVLIDRRALSKGDLPTLENYIRTGVMIREATISANWRLADKLIGTQTRLARELGLTPSARETMRPAPTEIDLADDLETFKAGAFDSNELQPWRPERLRDTD